MRKTFLTTAISLKSLDFRRIKQKKEMKRLGENEKCRKFAPRKRIARPRLVNIKEYHPKITQQQTPETQRLEKMQ